MVMDNQERIDELKLANNKLELENKRLKEENVKGFSH